MVRHDQTSQVTYDIARRGDQGTTHYEYWDYGAYRTALTGSTQDDMAELWRARHGELAPYTALVADAQTAGRGRVGRRWFSLPERSLTVSALIVLPAALVESAGWLTLIGGAAARSALSRLAGVSCNGTELKISWPNDVVAVSASGEQRKVAGVLGEYIGRAEETDTLAAVVGLGANLGLTEDELPTPTAASLRTAGFEVPDRGEVVRAWLQELEERVGAFGATGDPRASGVLEEINRECATLRPNVTVGRPRDTPVIGRGVRIVEDGSLIVASTDGEVVVTSGEVSLFGDMPRAVTAFREPTAGPEATR
ncbi:MAG: biotin--[acetyl-CoA-carboxylase] ligase [Ancrocorticia sp.]|jgi:birA, biotin-[acetyl-CoA-carboxylase] ligase region|nr:biotin--[acetyl-CoA-carboxylase] ligase [Ancrocorticia sp.]MCI2013018.1 biotin--[acetyl-CoA-carboxylase] ligase [Ancrocorticia sp.]MCI2029774.1 biotin--[acetyl-CoA-carboxylase] ligase [Ancrocorticia sp.]